MSENTLENIIFGLKEEIKGLKERGEKIINELHKTIDKQKAEIEQLKTFIDFKTANVMCEKCKEQIVKAETERLTAEIDQRREMMHRMDCNYATELQKNAELQKQVNELKTENTELYKEHTALIAGSILAKQNIVKDTAKEILTELDLFFNGTTFRKGYEFKKINEKLKEIAKRNGIEVE